MNGYDTWEDERPRLLHAVRESDGGPVALLLDRAANAARTEGLLAAAGHLEELRKELVGRRLFQGWDEGILCLCSLFKIIRQMSSEAEVPPEYRRLLNAEPSLRFDEVITPAQKEFWYGSSSEPVGGEIRIVTPATPAPAVPSGCVMVFAILAFLACASFWAVQATA